MRETRTLERGKVGKVTFEGTPQSEECACFLAALVVLGRQKPQACTPPNGFKPPELLVLSVFFPGELARIQQTCDLCQPFDMTMTSSVGKDATEQSGASAQPTLGSLAEPLGHHKHHLLSQGKRRKVTYQPMTRGQMVRYGADAYFVDLCRSHRNKFKFK